MAGSGQSLPPEGGSHDVEADLQVGLAGLYECSALEPKPHIERPTAYGPLPAAHCRLPTAGWPKAPIVPFTSACGIRHNDVRAGETPAGGLKMQVKGRAAVFAVVISGWIAVTLSSVQTSARQTQPGAAPAGAMSSTAIKAVLNQYCVTCHNQRLRTAGLALDDVDAARPAAARTSGSGSSRKLRAGSMPPAGRPRPDAATYHAVASWLESGHRSGMGGEPESGPDQRRSIA